MRNELVIENTDAIYDEEGDFEGDIKVEKYNVKKDDTSITRYFKEINNIPVLNREEERELAKRAFEEDNDARKELIRSNLRYVVKLAKKYKNYGLPFIDLINEGNLGLIQAVDRFDYTKGYRFLTYASWWIKQSILSALSEKTRLIRLPHNKTDRLRDVKKFKSKYLRENGEVATDETVSKAIGISASVLKKMVNASKSYVPLDTPVKKNNTEYFLNEILVNENQPLPEFRSIEDALKDSIEQSFEALSDKESMVLIHRFGLDSHEPKTLKQIGKMLNLSKERIRQIEKKALEKMQKPKVKKILEVFIEN